MSEELLHQAGEVQVTTSRFIVGSATYAIANLSSVRTHRKDPSMVGPGCVGLMGAFLMLGALAARGGEVAALLVSGAVVVGLAVLIAKSLKPTFSVVLVTTGGEVQALSSRDWPYIYAIVEAINSAIARR